jgi:hypothetical protein
MDIYLSTKPEQLSLLMAKINNAVDGEVVGCTPEQLEAYLAMEVVRREDQIKIADHQPNDEIYDHKWSGGYEVHPDDLEKLTGAKRFGCIRVRAKDDAS